MSEPRGDGVARLRVVLDAEERLYLELRELLQREREHMVNLDAAKLEEVAVRKEALASEGRLLEESRLAVAAELAAAVGLGGGRPTLSQLCDRLGEAAAPLRESHTRLVALLGAVRELADANASFAGDSLAQVRATLELLGRLLPTEPTYRPDALGDAPRAPARVLRRTA